MSELSKHAVCKDRRDSELPDLSSQGEDAPSRDGVLDDEALNMEPVLRPQPRLLSLDDRLLLSMTRANLLSQITVSSARGRDPLLRSEQTGPF